MPRSDIEKAKATGRRITCLFVTLGILTALVILCLMMVLTSGDLLTALTIFPIDFPIHTLCSFFALYGSGLWLGGFLGKKMFIEKSGGYLSILVAVLILFLGSLSIGVVNIFYNFGSIDQLRFITITWIESFLIGPVLLILIYGAIPTIVLGLIMRKRMKAIAKKKFT